MSTPCWVAGRAVQTARTLPVTSPYDDEPVGEACVAEPEHVEAAVSAAAAAATTARTSAPVSRAAELTAVAEGIRRDRQRFVDTIVAEAGKPVRWAEVEVDRAIGVFLLAAEQAGRGADQPEPVDADRTAVVRRVPRGAVLGITPFNFPLNLVAHKVAPALAAGAPIVIKPAPATPLTALLLGEVLAEAGFPEGAWSVLPVTDPAQLDDLVDDPRLPVVSFTGSDAVGHQLQARLTGKHLTLELGGNAAAIVLDDWPDLQHAAARIATFGCYQGGQSCIAVQRVIVTPGAAEELQHHLVRQLESLGTGDPRDPATVVGPLINAASVDRVEQWVGESGGRVLTGGRRTGSSSYAPTLLTDVAREARVWRDEVFGPVLVLAAARDAEHALELADDSRFGLQAGVFTTDEQLVARAFDRLDVGGVVIGDVPSVRVDALPYGGVKDSGVGREGVRAAMDDLTETRTLVRPAPPTRRESQ